MGIIFSSPLEKATILAYSEGHRLLVDYIGRFDCMFNPESYSLSSQIGFKQPDNLGKESESQFTSMNNETLHFKIIIDGSGADDDHDFFVGFKPFKEVSTRVADDIKLFRENILAYEGDMHQPPYLRVIWGELDFPCRLNSYTINYTLFSKSGIPLRAEVDVDFTYDRPQPVLDAIAAENSPDLTHIRVVKAHDRLPSMCEKIYGSSKYYLWVAKVNKLDDFRNLVPGQEVYFPPIEK